MSSITLKIVQQVIMVTDVENFHGDIVESDSLKTVDKPEVLMLTNANHDIIGTINNLHVCNNLLIGDVSIMEHDACILLLTALLNNDMCALICVEYFGRFNRHSPKSSRVDKLVRVSISRGNRFLDHPWIQPRLIKFENIT